MEQLFAFALVPIGARCCNDDYGARPSVSSLSSNSSFFSVYRQMRSLPSNYRLSSCSNTQIEVMGGFAHVA
ncbi:hypothetical protein Xind_01055 [Xenorhabdus indica]|uniref:Uncharacterized protein n=1 Tax=Xenorhabdus cabanillasii TaxID=351673 RepID=A0A3D9UMD9_9GAMM|nr:MULTISPECIES: hypothetical protein [Xenorhabdus]MBC8944602.1 hypothetical protein [Xenorhabdus indica]PHM77895.1 hypothetical protein Xcab_01569 [Xenorhabdus cabanillasii JM26]REF27805.1 hypothetical protein BDD26_2627 [Xenorhabdus cabanillasii]